MKNDSFLGLPRLPFTTCLLAVSACIACASESRPKSALSVDVAAADAASPTPAPDDPSAPGPVPAKADSPHPPTGEYSVSARVVADDCKPPYKPPPDAWTVLVQAGAERGRAKVNVPLGAIPPSNATHALDRSDLVIEPRRSFTHTRKPLPACASYLTTRTFEVVEAGPDGFKVVVTVEHGDALSCSSLQPSKCSTAVEFSYQLVRALCAAECTRGVAFRREGGVPDGGLRLDVDCRCP